MKNTPLFSIKIKLIININQSLKQSLLPQVKDLKSNHSDQNEQFQAFDSSPKHSEKSRIQQNAREVFQQQINTFQLLRPITAQFQKQQKRLSKSKDVQNSRIKRNFRNENIQRLNEKIGKRDSDLNNEEEILNHIVTFDPKKSSGLKRKHVLDSVANKLEKSQGLSPKAQHQSENHRNLVCVDCFNEKQIEFHKKQREERRQIEQSRVVEETYFMTKEKERQQKYEEVLQQRIAQINHFNQAQIDRHNKKKQQQQKQKLREQLLMERSIRQYENDQRQRQRFAEEQRQLFKSRLNQQIIEKESRSQRKGNEEHSASRLKTSIERLYEAGNGRSFVDLMRPHTDNQLTKSAVEFAQRHYKEDLLKQISENEIKKRQEQSSRKSMKGFDEGRKNYTESDCQNEFALITVAQQRHEAGVRLSEQMKGKYQEQIKSKQQERQRKRKAKRDQTRQEEKQRAEMLQEEQKRQSLIQEIRRNKIDNYLHELKNQIKTNKLKREKEIEWLNDRRKIEPLISGGLEFTGRAAEKEPCSSCEKKFPKRMLAEFNV